MFEETYPVGDFVREASISDNSKSSGAKSQAKGTQAPLALLADDDEDNLLLISYAMELFGIRFVTARTGREVMTLVRYYSFSLIVLDVKLSDIDGLELCSWLRQNPSTQTSPIIAVTALARLCDRQSIMAAGFTDYLLKPYMLEELNALIFKYLHRDTPDLR